MLRDTIFFPSFPADVELHHRTHRRSHWPLPWRKRIECNKFFMYSHLSLPIPRPKKKQKSNRKRKKLANKFEMENLLIMSTVFSMRFITQMLIFQPTTNIRPRGRKTQFRKLICIVSGSGAIGGHETTEGLTYRIQIAGQASLSFSAGI